MVPPRKDTEGEKIASTLISGEWGSGRKPLHKFGTSWSSTPIFNSWMKPSAQAGTTGSNRATAPSSATMRTLKSKPPSKLPTSRPHYRADLTGGLRPPYWLDVRVDDISLNSDLA